MELKKENPLSKNRTKLLGFLQKLGMSTSSILKVGRLLKDMPVKQAELKAKQILESIESCENEREVLEVLSL